EISCFNISKQKAIFEEHNIELDNIYYETITGDILVLHIHDGNIFPVIIYQYELAIKTTTIPSRTFSESSVSTISETDLEEKRKALQKAEKKKKAKRKQAAKAKKALRKR
ncbi:MAG: hypothetical protein HRU38_16535, partial [Saccharospirillaceae bacterium]|nr:hypothetical protein [Saccharospirillaceae bacterium]